MGWVGKPLAACAMATALLAGGGGAVAAADPGDPAASESTSVSDSDSGADKEPSPDPAPFSAPDVDRTEGTQSGDVGAIDTSEPQESVDQNAEEKKPAEDDSGGDRTIN